MIIFNKIRANYGKYLLESKKKYALIKRLRKYYLQNRTVKYINESVIENAKLNLLAIILNQSNFAILFL